MAAGTVTLLGPPTSTTGIRLSEPLVLTAAPYTGTGTVADVRVQIATDAGFTAVVFDSGLRAVDARKYGVGIWVEAFPDLIPLSASTVYYWRMLTRNSVPETSAYSSAFSFTTEAAVVSGAAWRAAQ